MEVHSEILSKHKIIKNEGMKLKQSLEELDLNTSDNTLGEGAINHEDANISKINIANSLNLSSLNNRTEPVCRTQSLLDNRLENHQSLVAESNLNKIDIKIYSKKKITSSLLNILRNHAIETCSSESNKNITYFYTLFQDCISNYIIEGFGGLVVDSLIDILLPASNLFSEMELECDFQNYYLIPSILYYYLVGMNPGNMLSSEKPFLSINSGNEVGSFLLPISRAVSEVDYSWLTRKNYFDLSEQLNNKIRDSKPENTKEVINIFKKEQIPNLVNKIISNLKNICIIARRNDIIYQPSFEILYERSPFVCENNQNPFFIGRLLEICLSKFQKEFTSMFLQLDGPLIIIPFIYYSSMQDFFLRFFGFIGNNCRLEPKYSEFSNSLLDFEYLESNQESLIGEFDTNKPTILEQFLNVGIPPILYEWVMESNFIQNFLSPLSDIINYSKEEFVGEPESEFKKTDIINAASGVIEVIFRLVEYMKPEHTGLPLNMTSIGLKWFTFASELNDQTNFYQQNEINENLHFSCEIQREISNKDKFVYPEDSVVESSQLNNSGIKTSQTFGEKNLEFENSGKIFNSNKIFNSEVNCFGKNKDDNGYYGTQIENYLSLVASGDGAMIRNLSVYQILEKSMWFLNGLIVDSPMLNLICELSIHNFKDTINEKIYILKLRSLNILEEILNLAFSKNINIIAYFKTKILSIIKPYLSKFCEFIISKFEISSYKNGTGYMVSLLTIIKVILLHDENHELIDNLKTEFWTWLLDLLIKRRENSHISVHCKTIFELGLRFGSCSTLENLFNNVKLVDKLSKFIYDGTDLDGNCIEEKELVNKKTGKRIRRVFGPICNLFMVLGKHYDDFLKMIVPSNPKTHEIIKNIIFLQLNKYNKIDDDTMEFISFVIKNEFEINCLLQKNEKFKFESSINMEPQKIIFLLANLSCSTKFHEFIKNYQNSCKSSNFQDSFSRTKDLDTEFTKNIENSPQSPNSTKHKRCTNLEDSSSVSEINVTNAHFLSTNFKNYFSGGIIDLFKCNENCECPGWSFSNVLNKLTTEKNCFNGISVFPVLPLEESRKIRETRKRQMKLYSSIQKSD
ncbi:uncharacterized protein cubi_00574 [Cryptosporidium ubiquitum]|uniref:Uncharacterized protein n=1 Tax=Cryptosporidium ubiquitum TaxID=857276 RepID=A0A1J4MCR4_9CRYT|nr:uncharacterized protein cubi_00574 [Cryptosporidium ubiquitum]OII71767.1 hypothetical protein cubi_00574 [Cryptosporidium ubiquitum]